MVGVLVFGVSSCASTREKPLPVEGARAELWLAPLASCAEERALETRKLDRRTQVRVDEYTTVDYVLARTGLDQQVVVTTDTDVESHFAEGTRVAEDVYTCAERQNAGRLEQRRPRPGIAVSARGRVQRRDRPRPVRG